MEMQILCIFIYAECTLFMSTLSAVVSIAMFFLLSYATNSMGTDLVTIDDPVVIKSLDDVIDRCIINGMRPTSSEWDYFAQAKEGSKEWKIFQLTEHCEDPKDKSIPIPRRFYTQKQVFTGIGWEALIQGYKLIMDPSSRFNASIGRLLLSVDDDAKKFSKVAAYSSRWKGTVIENLFNKL